MRHEPIHALQAAARDPARTAPPPSRLVIAGATGVLGNEVLRRLVGLQRYGSTEVLAREPIRAGLRGVGSRLVEGDDPAQWAPGAADTGLVLFEPPRLFYDRERALWTPRPGQLPALAQWMRRSGVRTLAIVLPHAQGRLPEALKRGLASLDEQAVAALGFERLLIVRSARKPEPVVGGGPLAGLARWMGSVFKYMLPDSEQPVRSAKVAEFVAAALQAAPPGIHVAAPETVWRAAQGPAQEAVHAWLRR
ncbi:hypothetical protein PE066_12650 [Ramlibacter tataouinensis]|uniref:hypothetical protein n=1 Tax=Ramlibacter tataouinensis TaxID=94132 RepID=UPI0022F3EA57|nr:hypothetical protein [Ramlibacter tataouinensis]WBY00323.1 hypothetical protein PE066_12650 [Ramlibacter tataouinensis]